MLLDEIIFQPCTTIKGQALVDFVAECTGKEADSPKDDPELDKRPEEESPQEENEDKLIWKLHVDGSATGQRFGARFSLITPGGNLCMEQLNLDSKPPTMKQNMKRS
uniref:Uncharacterized protein n=1 Tax=Cannabis sativa TaxID=3483 RepID=A0A803PYQ2_CANSA